MLATFESKISQTDAVNAMPLYPTEGILWDDNQVPNVHYTGALQRSIACCDLLCNSARSFVPAQ